jgi:hypothetical protein
VIQVAASPDTYLAAAAVRGVLAARQDQAVYAEQEIARASDEELALWARHPGPVGREVAVHAERTDARWFWLLALLTLGLEAVMRRTRAQPVQEAHLDAA